MKLLTKEIKEKLPELYSTEDVPLKQKEIVCKFFTPDANCTWYILEGSAIEGTDDWEFFCYADLGMGPSCSEYGAVLLSQLEQVRGQFGLPVERDYSFDLSGKKMEDVLGDTSL